VPAFRVKLGTNDLICVDVSLNPSHSLTLYNRFYGSYLYLVFVDSE